MVQIFNKEAGQGCRLSDILWAVGREASTARDAKIAFHHRWILEQDPLISYTHVLCSDVYVYQGRTAHVSNKSTSSHPFWSRFHRKGEIIRYAINNGCDCRQIDCPAEPSTASD